MVVNHLKAVESCVLNVLLVGCFLFLVLNYHEVIPFWGFATLVPDDVGSSFLFKVLNSDKFRFIFDFGFENGLQDLNFVEPINFSNTCVAWAIASETKPCIVWILFNIWIPVHLYEDIVLTLLTIFHFNVSVSILVPFRSRYKLYVSIIHVSIFTSDNNYPTVAIDIFRVPVKTPLVFLTHGNSLESRVVDS